MEVLINHKSDSQPLDVPQANEFEIDGENSWKNESKRRKVAIETPSGLEEKEKFKCDICNTNFKSKQGMKGHIATIHEGKKQFNVRLALVTRAI